MTGAPIIETARLRLRMPVLADFEPRAAFYASLRSVHEDGPHDRDTAWRIWASSVGQWPLMGYGPLSIEDRQGRYLGEVGLYHPSTYPGPELTWFLTSAAEGHGIASEAVPAYGAWAVRTHGFDRLVSYIGRGNHRALDFARRLGAVEDTSAPRPPVTNGLVFRHDIGRFLAEQPS